MRERSTIYLATLTAVAIYGMSHEAPSFASSKFSKISAERIEPVLTDSGRISQPLGGVGDGPVDWVNQQITDLKDYIGKKYDEYQDAANKQYQAFQKSATEKIDSALRERGVLTYDSAEFTSVTLGGLRATSTVQVKNVAPGRLTEGSTDAVNGAQLFSTSSSLNSQIGSISDRLMQLERKTSPADPSRDSRNADQKRLALDGAGSRITNVANGIAETDGVNVQQLNEAVASATRNAVSQANSYTDSQMKKMRSDVEHNRKDAAGGTASAIAISNLPQAYQGESMVSVAGGAFGGQSAVALGLSTSAQKWSVKASFTTNTRGSYGGGAGVGYRF